MPWALVLIGAGATIGNFTGGWATDLNLKRTVFIGFGLMLVTLASTGLLAQLPIALCICLFLVAFASSVTGPAIQGRLLDVAGDSQTLAAAINHAAFNIGNSLGALLGGMVIAAGFGFQATPWVGFVLASLGLAVAVYALRFHRTANIEHTQPLRII